MKKQTGITLIALVITIIVLLILAGVSIAAITGENGIVNKAKEAKEKTEQAEEEELEALGSLEDLINSSTTDLESSEPDPTFPYGTLYVIQNDGYTVGVVIYENGKGEMIESDGTYSVVTETTGTGQFTIEGNTIKMGTSDWATISDDYNTLTLDSDMVFNKTTTTYTYCVHDWGTTDELDGDVHQCSKCDIYGIHEFDATETVHECECGLSGAHSYGSEGNCTDCGYGCIHDITEFSHTTNSSGEYILIEVCNECNETVSTDEGEHIEIGEDWEDNGDGTHTYITECECGYPISTSIEEHESAGGTYTDNGDGTHTISNIECWCGVSFPDEVESHSEEEWQDGWKDNGDGTHTSYLECGCGAIMEEYAVEAHEDFYDGYCYCGALVTTE